jgi:DNA replication protein DnaC
MQKLHRKTFLLFLLLVFLTILLGFATNVLSEDFDKWCVEYFGADYKPWLLGLLIAGTFIALYFTTDLGKNLFSKKTDDRPLSLSPEETQKNYDTIRQYLLEKRYRPRLQQKLAGDQLFNLRVKPTSIGASAEKAATFVTLKGKKTGEEIRQIFEQSRRRLLVTGAPGAGKTSLLLHLAIELLETDHENLTAVLNLATWNSSFATLDDWLREILPAELGVTKRYAADILQQGKLTLLLDGLDEVDKSHRASCLDAIKSYSGKRRTDFVISTRKDEYKALEKDAPVWAQIEVLPLTKAQLLAQLDRADRRDFPEAPDLKAALQNNPLLLKVAETPFYLNCLQLLFRGGSTLSELNFKGETVEARQAEIVERFTKQALAMRSPNGYTPEQVQRWLSFFASRLTQRNKVVFELVDLQYDWWKFSKRQLIPASMMDSIVPTLAKMCIFLLVFGLIGSCVQGSLMSFLFTLKGIGIGILMAIAISYLIMPFSKVMTEVDILGASSEKGGTKLGHYLRMFGRDMFIAIETKDKLLWSWTNFNELKKNQFLASLFLGVVIGTIFLLVNFLFGEASLSSLKWAVIILIYVLGIWLYSGIAKFMETKYKPFLQITTPYQRFTASAKALHFSILQHWLLRWQLYSAGVLPLRLVNFLNEMTERHLLESDGTEFENRKIVKSGATWRFRHRILQEYFAMQW